MRPLVAGVAAGLTTAAVALGAYLYMQSEQEAGTEALRAFYSSQAMHDYLAGTEAACVGYTPVQPLHEATDAVNCRILGVTSTLSVYASEEPVQRELKAFGGRGVGRYEGMYFARVAGPNWIIAIGGMKPEPVMAAAKAAQKAVGGKIDHQGW